MQRKYRDKDCATGVNRNNGICGVFTKHLVNDALMPMINQMPVLVWIRDGSKNSRPVNSLVGLQPLDVCRMRIADASEVRITPSLESLWRVLDGELSAILNRAGIKDRQFVDDIIQCGSQVVNDLADENGNDQRDRAFGACVDNWWAGLRIEVNRLARDLVLVVKEPTDGFLQLRKVFSCPIKPDISSIKRMHDIYSEDEEKTNAQATN